MRAVVFPFPLVPTHQKHAQSQSPASRILPATPEQGAGSLLIGHPDLSAGAASWGAGGAGQHWAVAGDRWVSRRGCLRTAALAVGLWLR
jgi:hypothetical protein